MCRNVCIYDGPGGVLFGSDPILTRMCREGFPGPGAVNVERKCLDMQSDVTSAGGGKPCLRCTRVPAPDCCNDKNCRLWQAWFVDRWDALRLSARQVMEAEYMAHDPCAACLCPKNLCSTPCRMKRVWLGAKEVSQ